MRVSIPRWLVLALALTATGCLLPQPDTPPVPPGAMPGSSTGQAGAPVAPNTPTGVAGPTNGAATKPQSSPEPEASTSPSPSPSSSPSPGNGATQVAPVQ